MQTKRCSRCEGKKKIMGLGGMLKICPICDGVGHVKVEESKGKKS